MKLSESHFFAKIRDMRKLQAIWKSSGVYRKAKNNPLIIWIIKHNPNIDPKFQNKLILIGVGRLINELLTIDTNIWLF